jgi:hypothetical protein
MERGVFRDPTFVQRLNDVCVPLVMPTSYKDYPSVQVNGQKRYKDYPRLTIEEAKGFTHSAESAVDYQEYEKWVTPVYCVGNSKKELIIKTLDRKVVRPDRIFQDIAAAQKKLGGTGATQSVWRQFRKVLEALDREEFGASLKAAAELDKAKGLPEPLQAELSALRRRIEEKGEERLQEAAAADDRAKLEKLAAEFKGHALEARIRERLK